ncbi:uncharacterized protein LOC115301139 [Suricata suricatta]|uniref:uncharacterized protein LOC115301139 n=1 Tax=Suricata suricatta TaxID=37032 RepID=UPI00115591B1|nr:uncharacterized protein LOC115301139 [Suricata suricatta]
MTSFPAATASPEFSRRSGAFRGYRPRPRLPPAALPPTPGRTTRLASAGAVAPPTPGTGCRIRCFWEVRRSNLPFLAGVPRQYDSQENLGVVGPVDATQVNNQATSYTNHHGPRDLCLSSSTVLAALPPSPALVWSGWSRTSEQTTEEPGPGPSWCHTRGRGAHSLPHPPSRTPKSLHRGSGAGTQGVDSGSRCAGFKCRICYCLLMRPGQAPALCRRRGKTVLLVGLGTLQQRLFREMTQDRTWHVVTAQNK